MQTTILASFLCVSFLLQPIVTFAQDEEAKSFQPGETPSVQRIVFFNSGIAHVLHQGKISGNRLIEISFDREQIDDVLKSIVFDNESGSIESVQYQPAPGKELLAAQRLGPPMTLAQTLQNYRGEQVTLTTDGNPANGSILGVETRTQGDTSHDILTLVSDEGLKTYNLTDLKSIQFDSKKIQDELRLGMIGLSNDRDVQKKSLSLFFAGEKERKIQFGYVVDAPIWRMTYRLDVGAKQSTLQGWAHIDNVTGFDWENVFVDLRSGRPQAFNVDLFAPLVAVRPTREQSVFGIPPELNISPNFGLAGRLADTWDAFDTGNSYGRRYRGFGGGFGGGGGGGGGGAGGTFGGTGGGGSGTFGSADPSDAREEMDIEEGFEVTADQGRASRMLQFEIEKPINLASGRSAMLPILSQDVETELQTFFDLTKPKSSGQLIIKMTNGKTFSIVAGPTTVYQQGNFIGDSTLDRIDVNETTKLAYGQDQPIGLSLEPVEHEMLIQTARLIERRETPTIMIDGLRREVHKIVIDNKDVSDRNIRIKMRIDGAKVSPDPIESSDGFAEFEFKVPANRKHTETINLDTKTEGVTPLTNITPKLRDGWKKMNVKLDPQVEDLLSQYFEALEEFGQATDKVAELAKQVRENQAEEDRLTKLIQAVKSETAAAPFVEKLTKFDKQMDELKAKLATAEKELKSKHDAMKEITGE